MTIPLKDPFAPFEPKIRDVLFRHRLLPDGERPPRFSKWTVALSGGGDSVFLSHLLKRLCPPSITLTLAHFNHHTHRKKNQEDAAFATLLAENLGISLLLGVSSSPQLTRPNLSETVLRKERYSFFEDLLLEDPQTALFLAHQRDDRIETILSNLFRGGGPRSLIGMESESRGRMFRPLLDIGREDIRNTLHIAGIPYREDPENLNLAHLRNRIRHQVRPEIDRMFPPNGTAHLSHLAFLMEREIEVPEWSPDLLCERNSIGWIRFSLFLYQSLRPSAQGYFLRFLLNHQIGFGLPVPPERNLLRTLEASRSTPEIRDFPLGNGWSLSIVFGRTDLVYKYPEPEPWRHRFDFKTLSLLDEPIFIDLPRGGALHLRSAEAPLNRERTTSRTGNSVWLPICQELHDQDALSVGYWFPGLRIYQGSNSVSSRTVASTWKDRPMFRGRKSALPILLWKTYALWIPGILDSTVHLPDNKSGQVIQLTFQERERSEWKKFLGSP